jgi:hypothetical protein
VKRAQQRAEWAEQDAAAATGFAVFAIEQAEYAVLDAIITREEATPPPRSRQSAKPLAQLRNHESGNVSPRCTGTSRGTGPPFYKVGKHNRWKRGEVMAWFDAHLDE